MTEHNSQRLCVIRRGNLKCERAGAVAPARNEDTAGRSRSGLQDLHQAGTEAAIEEFVLGIEMDWESFDWVKAGGRPSPSAC